MHKCRDAVTHQIVAGQAAGHRADGACAIMSQEITQCVMQGRHLALVDHLLGEIAEVAVQMGHFEDAICLLTAFEHAERLGGADDGVGSDPSRHAFACGDDILSSWPMAHINARQPPHLHPSVHPLGKP